MEETEIVKIASPRGSPKEPSTKAQITPSPRGSPKEPSIKSQILYSPVGSPKEPSIKSQRTQSPRGSPKEPSIKSQRTHSPRGSLKEPSSKSHRTSSPRGSPKEPSIKSQRTHSPQGSLKEPSTKSHRTSSPRGSPKEPSTKSPRTPSPRRTTKEPSIKSLKTPSPQEVTKEPSIKYVNEASVKSQPASIKDFTVRESPFRLPPSSQPESSNMSPKAVVPPPTISSIRSENSRHSSLLSEKNNKIPYTELEPEQRSHGKRSNNEMNIANTIANFQPQGQNLTEHIDELSNTIETLAKDLESPPSPQMTRKIDKIAQMSKQLTSEANALRNSIKTLSQDIAKTKNELSINEDVNFPYHLFLIEIIVNKIHMKCDCFEIDCNNLVIAATFLGKHPIVLYDSSYGKIENFSKLNVGKSTLFAMTYDKICSIKEFEILLQMTKQPPCSSCVTKIGETYMDYTKEFVSLREELCRKWVEQKPEDNIKCTTSTPQSKNMYYLSCGDRDHHDSIGVIEVTVRMSFLGKEITTAFCASPKPQTASFLLKEDNGMTMYSCHKVEMDDQGKILLDEDVMTKKATPKHNIYSRYVPTKRSESPMSQLSSVVSSKRSYDQYPVTYSNNQDEMPKYDEIFTKMNANELKIRVPKSTKVERMGKYDKIQELCSCESSPYNTGEQIQFELPRDSAYPSKSYGTHTSNLKYTYRGCDSRKTYENKDRRIVNVTPSNCPVPVDMEKIVHPQKDVFILKIGKKLETKDKKTDLEIEFVTPKAPPEKPVDNTHISQQCSSGDLKKKDIEDKKKIGKEKRKKGKGKEKKAEKAKKKKKKLI